MSSNWKTYQIIEPFTSNNLQSLTEKIITFRLDNELDIHSIAYSATSCYEHSAIVVFTLTDEVNTQSTLSLDGALDDDSDDGDYYVNM